MSEHLGSILSVFAIVMCIISLRSRRGGNRRAPVQTPASGGTRSRTSTGPVIYFASDDCGLPSREYCFDYRKVNNTWRVYILKMPPLNRRSGAGSLTHRLSDGQMHYICWDRPIRTLENAQTISRAWADNVQRYIATGQRF